MSMAVLAGAAGPALLSSVAGPLIGGLLGGSEGARGQQQTSQQTLDPRLAKYLYGDNGSGGLLGSTSDLYQKQLGQGGLNPMQNAGLEMQRQTLTDPRMSQGYNQMRDMGMNLMGGGAAGNPFTRQGGQGGSNMGFGNPQPMVRPLDPSQQNAGTSAAYQPIGQSPAMQAPAPAAPQVAPDYESMMQEYLKRNNYQQFAPDRGEAGGGR